MRVTRAIPLLALVFVAGCRLDSPVSSGERISSIAASQSADSPEGGYIVVFDDSVSDPAGLAKSLAGKYGKTAKHIYKKALKGFAAPLTDADAMDVAQQGAVRRVERDGVMLALGTEAAGSWGLDRLDQRNRPLDGGYTYNYTGSGVTAYIIDTGIRFDHNEFRTSATDATSRASFGFDAVGDGRNGADCNGHGTHVSGTVGGLTYGVAKGVRLVAVRVLNCNGSGSTSGVIAGVDWVSSNHAAGAAAVANMSLGGSLSASLNDAVRRAISDGVVMALAAGNSNADACSSSPASTAEAITVGASDINDVRASFSNWGSCVDWFAPGVNITSAGFTSPSGTAVYSGTSMASPHSAGAAALYLEAFPGSNPAAVRDGLYGLTTKGIVTQSNTANNHLLYSLGIGSGGGPIPPPSADNITLNATLRVKGNVKIDLSWSGSSAANIDVFRNNVRVATVANTGSYSDSGLSKRGGSYRHKVCNAGTNTCSNETLTTY